MLRSGRIGQGLIIALVLAGVEAVAAQGQSPSHITLALPECAAAPPASAAPAGSPAPASPAAAAGDLIVFAAASLRGVFEAFAPTVQAETGLGLTLAFDSSSALRTQIEQGAPADVFASADTANVATLIDQGLAGDPVVFACNQLTIIVPVGNPAGIRSAADLGRPGVRVVAAGDAVPITKYALQLVSNLGIAEAYAADIATREDNVAAVRSRIELGEGDAGIVYMTDAIASGDKVERIEVPADANVPATYAAAVVSASDQPAESAAFLDWLTGDEGQGELGGFGFLPAP